MTPTTVPAAYAGNASLVIPEFRALCGAPLRGRIFGYVIIPFLIAYISSIQIPGLRWSPVTLLVGMIMLFAVYDWLPDHFRLLNADRRALVLFFMLSLFDAVTQYWFIGTIPAVVISAGSVCCYFLITYQGACAFEKAARVFYFLLGVSMTVFLIGLLSPSVASALNPFLPALDRFNQARFRGLARAEHILAYHLVFFWIWSFVKFLSVRRVTKKLPFAVCCAVSSLALLIQGSRMGLISITLVMLIIIGVVQNLRTPKLTLMTAALLILCIAWLSAPIFQTYNRNLHAQERGTVLDRMQADEDFELRFSMQRHALEIISQNPLGLRASGKEWEGEIRPRMREYFIGTEGALSVHNQFLYAIMNNGWIFGGIVILLVGYALGISIQMLRRASLAVAGSEWDVILPACFIADCLNGCVHHAGFLNEPVSAVVLLLLLVRHSLTTRAISNAAISARHLLHWRRHDTSWAHR